MPFTIIEGDALLPYLEAAKEEAPGKLPVDPESGNS